MNYSLHWPLRGEVRAALEHQLLQFEWTKIQIVLAWREDEETVSDPDDDPCRFGSRSEEHTSELQSPDHPVCRLLLEKNCPASTADIRLAERSPARCRTTH